LTASHPSPQRPTKRQVVTTALWWAGLSAFGALPAACSSRASWTLLPPRPVDWTMKPLSSAKVTERALSGGRVELRVEHELLAGVMTRRPLDGLRSTRPAKIAPQRPCQ
jgi:hypothetical protein